MLQCEGVEKCLPHLREDQLEKAVQEYHSIRRDYKSLAKQLGVLAFRVGQSVTNGIFLILRPSELGRLSRVLSRDNDKISQYCEIFASGTFADVYKFKTSAKVLTGFVFARTIVLASPYMRYLLIRGVPNVAQRSRQTKKSGGVFKNISSKDAETFVVRQRILKGIKQREASGQPAGPPKCFKGTHITARGYIKQSIRPHAERVCSLG